MAFHWSSLGFLTIARLRLLEARVYWLHPLATVTALRFYLLTPPVRPVLLGTLYQVGHIWGTRMLDIGHYDHKAWRVDRGIWERDELYGSRQSGDQEKHWSCVHKIILTSSPLSPYYQWQMSGSYWVLELKRWKDTIHIYVCCMLGLWIYQKIPPISRCDL